MRGARGDAGDRIAEWTPHFFRMKPGIKTTEFWLIAATVILSLVGALTKHMPAEVAATVATILPILYTGLRSWAKHADAEQRLREIQMDMDFALPDDDAERTGAAVTSGEAKNVQPFPGGNNGGQG